MGYFIGFLVMLAALAALGAYALRFQEWTPNDRRYVLPGCFLGAGVGCELVQIARAIASNTRHIDDGFQLGLQIAQIVLMLGAGVMMLRVRFARTHA
jgi:hypothetical protein